MKKLRIVAALVCLLGLAFAATQVAYQYGLVATSLSAVTTTGAGTEFAMPVLDDGHSHPGKITWQYFFGGGSQPTSHTTALEGSIDNSHWFTLDSSTSITSTFADGSKGEMRHIVNKNVGFLRCDITAITLGGATSETCQFTVQKP